MKKLPKEKRDRIVLTALATLVILIAMWYGLISIQKASISRVTTAIEEERDKVVKGKRLVAQVEEIKAELETANRRLRAIEADMASGDKYSWIIQTLKEFLVKHNYRENNRVEIPQFSREVPCNLGLFAEFPYEAIAFTVRGSAFYHDFGAFVADFENAFPFLRIQNIDLDPIATSTATVATDPEKLNFKLEIVALVNPGR